jgi:TRAP-type mannitol/chloroaromatic compound transport system substrate-binding protein
MYANEPRSLAALVSEHGVQVRAFPEEIVEAGAKASVELMTEIREGGDPLTKKTAESFIAAFNLLRTRTENTDVPYLIAREKYVQYS